MNSKLLTMVFLFASFTFGAVLSSAPGGSYYGQASGATFEWGPKKINSIKVGINKDNSNQMVLIIITDDPAANPIYIAESQEQLTVLKSFQAQALTAKSTGVSVKFLVKPNSNGFHWVIDSIILEN